MAGESFWIEDFIRDMEKDRRFTKDGVSMTIKDLGYSLSVEICVRGRKEDTYG